MIKNSWERQSIKSVWLLIACIYLFGFKALAGEDIEAPQGIHQHDTVVIDSNKNMSEQLYFRDPKLALTYANRAFVLSHKIKDSKRMIESLSLMGASYQMLPDFGKALHSYFKALRLAEKGSDKEVIAGLYSDIGACYIYNKQFDASLTYLNKAIKLQMGHSKNKLLATTYNNIGLLYSEKGDYTNSIYYYAKALEIDNAIGEKEEKGCTLINIADVYRKKGNIKLAKTYYRQALPLCVNNPYYKTACYIDLGLIEKVNKQYDTALYYLMDAKQTSTQAGLFIFMARIYNAISGVYEAKGEHALALRYNKLYHQTKDSTYNLEVNKQIDEVRTIYEAEKKDEQIKQLTIEKARTEEEKSLNTLIRNLFAFISVLVVIVCVILWRNIFLKQSFNNFLQKSNENLSVKNQELNEKNAQIEAQKKQIEIANEQLHSFNAALKKENIAAQYEVLQSKVNPHFLFNCLATLSAIVIEDTQMAQEYIGAFSKMYRAILNYGDKDILSVAEEFDITQQYLYLQQMKFGENIKIEIDDRIKTAKGGLPPLSLQMVVENVFKHNKISKQFPLTIKMAMDNNCVVVTNNLQKRSVGMESTKTGLNNINDRYLFLEQQVLPVFKEEDNWYLAILPIIQTEEIVHNLIET